VFAADSVDFDAGDDFRLIKTLEQTPLKNSSAEACRSPSGPAMLRRASAVSNAPA
jgi:hypothetical protein